MDEHEELTLLSLPDVPLLRVLSHLPIKDLVSAGHASPRLGDLTRTNLLLWLGKGKKLFFKDVGGALDLVRVSPPVDKLSLIHKRMAYGDEGFFVRFRNFAIKLVVVGSVLQGAGEKGIRLLVEVWPKVKHLVISGANLSWLCVSLKSARGLETLTLTDWIRSGNQTDDVAWPQEVVMPKLHTLRLFISDGISPSPVELDKVLKALGSLLRAHSGQMRSLKLDSTLLFPLVDSCSTDLRRLDVSLKGRGDGDLKGLRRLTGLKELRINLPWIYCLLGSGFEEVEDLLRSCSSSLERLEIANAFRDGDGALRVLGAGGFASLQHLVLTMVRPVDKPLRDLGPALAGLHSLRSIVLTFVPVPELIRRIATDAIPALELLVVAGNVNCEDECPPYRYEGEVFEDVAQLPVVLQDLVRRAPRSLHALLRLPCETCLKCTARAKPTLVRCMFCKHPAAQECPLCVEAAAIAATVVLYGVPDPRAIPPKEPRVQVL